MGLLFWDIKAAILNKKKPQTLYLKAFVAFYFACDI